MRQLAAIGVVLLALGAASGCAEREAEMESREDGESERTAPLRSPAGGDNEQGDRGDRDDQRRGGVRGDGD